MKYTDQELVESARKYPDRTTWYTAENKLWRVAYFRGLLPVIYSFLPPKEHEYPSAYTDQELLEDAKKYSDRQAWKKSGEEEYRQHRKSSHYRVAIKRGYEFFSRCCAHMPKLPTNLKGEHLDYTDDQVKESAAKFKHRSDWKNDPVEGHLYRVAQRRKLLEIVCSHMAPKANPYAGDYIVYAYEFDDHSAYVGLTFQPERRHSAHLVKGPVCEHILVCPGYVLKTVQEKIEDPRAAVVAEREWIRRYAGDGWKMLNSCSGGSTGSVYPVLPDEEILFRASGFKSRKHWLIGDQSGYKAAKRRGGEFFERCCEHMVRPATWNAGKKFSEESRRKMSESAQRRTSDPVWRAEHSTKLTGRKLSEEHKRAVSVGNTGKGRPAGWKLTVDEAISLGFAEAGYHLLTEPQMRLVRRFRYHNSKRSPGYTTARTSQ